MARRIFIILAGFSLALLTAGCQGTKSRVVEGTVIGGLLGATAGGIIGHQSGHGAEGAGIGAATGAIAGALIGSQIEKSPSAAQISSAQPHQLSISQIIELSQQGINEDVIIDKIRLTNSRFNLTAQDINYLKEHGVSPRVIAAMQGG